MADKDLKLALLLKLNDQMSKGLRVALKTVQDESKKTSRSIEDIAKAANKVKPTGFERLNSVMKTMQGTAKGLLSTLTKAGQVGVAGAAGGYVLKSAAAAPMAYDRRLALLSNTANSDNQDPAFRISQKSQLHEAIKSAVKAGGGTAEQAVESLNLLVGSGAFGKANQAISLLPTLQKYATASSTPGTDLAQILVAAKQNMGISDQDIPAMLSKAMKAGQAGGFELSDMAKWLPQQMSLAAANGMKGMGGFESLLAANQAGRIVAGTSDEAGNNLVNLLAKINSSDTAADFKKQGINLSGSLAAARGKGMNTLEAFLALVEKIGSRDKTYSSLRKKADKETGADLKATMSAQADILQQGVIGKVVQDRQTLMELLGLIQQRSQYDDVKAKTARENGKEGAASFDVMASTPSYKTEKLANTKAFAAIDTLGAIDAPLGKLLDKINEEATAHPILTTAIYASATALTALTAAAGVGSLVGLSKAGGGGVLGKVAAAGAGALSSAPLMLAGAGAVGYGAGTGISKGIQAWAPGVHDWIGEQVASYRAAFGNREAERALNINLSVDGKQLATVVNNTNSKEARRH